VLDFVIEVLVQGLAEAPFALAQEAYIDWATDRSSEKKKEE
jgi:hypothetical protein